MPIEKCGRCQMWGLRKRYTIHSLNRANMAMEYHCMCCGDTYPIRKEYKSFMEEADDTEVYTGE